MLNDNRKVGCLNFLNIENFFWLLNGVCQIEKGTTEKRVTFRLYALTDIRIATFLSRNLV